MSNTKRDKYDEVADIELVTNALRRALSYSREEQYVLDALEAMGRLSSRSAFPPPAKDATSLMRSWANKGWLSSYHADEDECVRLAAEIESFAQSRVEPWREALRRALVDFEKNDWGTELPSASEAWVHSARALLSASLAKEKA